jgi:(R,R)-butanediol dehydrogenase/meso-butanediol dehydrogenase/diacetyl reductase
MRAALITGRHQVELQVFPDPTPTTNDVVVDVTFCGVCGTDAHAWSSGNPYTPAICGHEWTGYIRATGPAVPGMGEGDRVVIAVPPACGRCGYCLIGDPAHCERVLEAAIGQGPSAPRHGGFAPSICVDAGRVIMADARLTDEQCALVEPATVVFHAVYRSSLRPGDRVVVQGGGPIGLLTLQFAKAAGAGSVLVVEPSPSRRQLARTLGADHAVSPGAEATQAVLELTGGLGADLVYECAGIGALVQTAVDFVRRGGHVMLIGYPLDHSEVDTVSWLHREVTVGASLGYTRQDFPRAMGLIADQRVDVLGLHSATVGLSGLAGVLEDLASGHSQQQKVLVDPRVDA